MLIRRALVLTVVALAGMAGSAQGATLSFTGTFSSDWNTAANWTNTANASLHAVPTAVDIARIPLGKAPVLATGADGAARSVALDPGASLSVSGHQLSVAGGATSVFQGAVSLTTATLRLGGVSTWSGGNWSLAGSTVSNSGTLTITGDVTATQQGTVASRVTNLGTITRNDATPTTGTAAFTAPLVNDGTLSVVRGSAELRAGGGPSKGSFAIAANTVLATAGVHALGDLGAVTGAGTLRLDGGSFEVPATANVFAPGTLLLSGGFLDLGMPSRVGRLTSDGEGGGRRDTSPAVLTAGGPTLLDNVTLENSATTLTGPVVTLRQLTLNGAVLSLGASARTLWDRGSWDLFASRVENAGDLRITGDGSVLNRVSSTVENAGTLTRDDAAAGGVASIRAALLNDGDVNVVAGELAMGGSSADSSGGTFTVGAQAVLSTSGAPALSDGGEVTGAGTVRLDSGTLSVPPGTGVFNPATVLFSGGFLNLGRNATVGRLTSDGQGGGRTTGSGTLTAGGPTLLANVLLVGGTTNLTGPAVTLRSLRATQTNLNLTAAAHAVWDAGAWQLNEATVSNAGELRVTGDGTVADVGAPALVRNTGTLIRDDADPSTTGAPFTARLRNSGVLQLVKGALDLGTLGEQTAGRTIVDSGAVLGGPSAQYTVAGGRVEGTGTVAGALDNAGGTVGPGAPSGVLSVDGTYTQGAGGTLETQISGLDPGTGYDRVAVSGSATLAGTLDIVTPTAFVPPLPSIYGVVTADGLGGAFDAVVGADLADRSYVVDYSADPGRVRLRVSVDETEGLVAVSAGSLEFTGAAGAVANNVTLSGPAAGSYSVRDTAAPVAAGAGCVQASANLVRCGAAGVTQGALDLGPGNDAGSVLSPLPTTLTGGAGADKLTGGTGADALAGGPGNDTLTGGDGADTLRGRADNDVLNGGNGPDALQGGGGVDSATYAGRAESVTVRIGGLADDGGSSDGPAGARDNVGVDVEDLVGGSGADSLTGSAAVNRLTGNPGNDTLSGADGNDRLLGGDGADSLLGGAHNDSLDGGLGPDAMVGGAGVDSATYAGRTESVTVRIGGLADDGGSSDGPAGARDNVRVDVEDLVGGSGADSLTGSSAVNRLTGNPGNDTLSGADGNDRLLGGDGADSLLGGAHNDSLDGGLGRDAMVGGAGVDSATYAGRTESVTVTIGGLADDGGSSDGPAGARDNVRVDVEDLLGGSGADSLTGSSAANRLTGGLGADALRGLEGNDTLVAKDGVADTALDCDGGAADIVTIDPTDPPSVGCEAVRP